MTIFFLVVFGGYLFFVLFLLYGWSLSLGKTIPIADTIHSIAVVVPIRNEQRNIDSLIKSLMSIRYDASKLEFIFVNDHSTDDSFSILSSCGLPNHKVVNLEAGQSGKKAALKKGIETATSDLIVTTDADCTHPSDWLSSVNALFSDARINMVVGAVAISNTRSFFSKIQTLEFTSLISSGASMLHWKIPAMANGANLAFRRSIFFTLLGYEGNEHIPSGDDEYLLKKFFAHSPVGVVFNNSPESVVITKPQDSIRTFFQQRIRWAGKWKLQSSNKAKWIAFLVFIFQCSFIGALAFYFFTSSKLILLLLLSKVVMEAVFLLSACQFLKVRLSLLPFALLQIIYPFYVVATAIGSLFLTFEWKGRKY